MQRNNIILASIATITLLGFVAFATYAYLNVSNIGIVNAANVNAVSEKNNMVFVTTGGSMSMTATTANMTQANNNTLAASNTVTLKVDFTANATEQYTCTYDIVYEWTSSNKYQVHNSTADTPEYSIQATLASNSYVNEGLNHIKNEQDLAGAVGENTTAVVVKGAQITSTGTNKRTATWTITGKIYNVNVDQTNLLSKTFAGRFKVANVSCVKGALDSSNTLAKYLVNTANKTGTSAVGSFKWNLVLDHPGEWRYTGKNPNNYITFNGELWRIIGVIPDVTYCEGSFTATACSGTTKVGAMVKIVRNASEGTMAWASSGGNKWQTAQMQTTLNGKTYASDSHVAIAKWNTTGYSAISATPVNFHKYEYGTTGLVPSGYSKFWFGKVATIHAADYAYATIGNAAVTGTYSRTGCLKKALNGWTSSYKTYCALTDWLAFNNITSTAPASTITAWWTMAPISGATTNAIAITTAGISATVAVTNSSTYNARPVVYLKPETLVSGSHSGAYDDPITIS